MYVYDVVNILAQLMGKTGANISLPKRLLIPRESIVTKFYLFYSDVLEYCTTNIVHEPNIINPMVPTTLIADFYDYNLDCGNQLVLSVNPAVLQTAVHI